MMNMVSLKSYQHLIGQQITDLYLNPSSFEDLRREVEVFEDFVYISSGIIHLRLNNQEAYCIGNLNHTQLGTDFVGIKHIELAFDPYFYSTNPDPLKAFLNTTIRRIHIFWSPDNINDPTSETVAEYISIEFDGDRKLVVFCGEFEETDSGYNLIPGHPALLLFTQADKFETYKTSPVISVDTVH